MYCIDRFLPIHLLSKYKEKKKDKKKDELISIERKRKMAVLNLIIKVVKVTFNH